MAKAEKTKKERAKNYDEKLAVKASFADIIKAAANNANKKSAKKKSNE